MQIQVLNAKGNSSGKITLAKEIFSAEENKVLLAQAVRVYNSNQRRAQARTKTRGEVAGSRKKIWRQKGTGRARHGDRYAPIFVGGGVAHGPTGLENSKRKLSKNIRQKAFVTALSQKVRANQLLIVDGFEKLEPKTKIVNTSLNEILKNFKEKPKNILIVLGKNAQSLVKGARNLKNVKLISAQKLNTAEIINSDIVIILKNALKTIEELHLKKNSSTKTDLKIDKKKNSKQIKDKK